MINNPNNTTSHLIDLECPSELPVERRSILNQMAVAAHISENGDDSKPTIDELNMECLTMIDIIDEILNVGLYIGFFENIDSAFELLIQKEPDNVKEIFRTYTTLSNILRVIQKNEAFLDSKVAAYRRVISDIELLETEGFGRKDERRRNV